MAVKSKKVVSKTKKRIKKKVPIVKVHLRANFNNSIVTLTDLDGKVLAWSSSGKVGFKGSKKSTPFAAQKATEEVLEKAKEVEANSAHIVVWGAGMGRDSFIRTIQGSDLQIESIKDATGFPHGGVTKRKKRRV